jgi:hypothetical protein
MPARVAIPSLDDLAADPGRAGVLPANLVTALLARNAVAHAALAQRLVTLLSEPSPESSPGPDRLLTPSEAAGLLGVTVTWLYRHHRTLPFARRLSRKCLRFSEAGLRRWQTNKR